MFSSWTVLLLQINLLLSYTTELYDNNSSAQFGEGTFNGHREINRSVFVYKL